MKKNLFILGASGSIGSQTLEILPSFLAKYNLVGVSIGHNVSFLENHIWLFPHHYSLLECRLWWPISDLWIHRLEISFQF